MVIICNEHTESTNILGKILHVSYVHFQRFLNIDVYRSQRMFRITYEGINQID